MLTYLKIKNFALIENVELDFLPKMTVVTGETGAGKSLIVDTLELVLGARADSNVIGAGADKCELTAIFEITKLVCAQAWLNEHELDSIGECIIYRSLSKDGRSRVTINGQPCTQQLVRELGNLLINIHGQHEHQNLLKNDVQLNLLDTFANNDNMLINLKKIYTKWQILQQELEILQHLNTNRTSKMDLLAFQVQELDDLALQPNEITELHKEHSSLSHAEETIQSCSQALNLISENEDNALRQLNSAKEFIQKIKLVENDRIKTIVELLINAVIQTEEATLELRHYLSNIELNQGRQKMLEEKLIKIHDLARKHKVSPEELPQTLVTLKDELQKLTDAESMLKNLQDKICGLDDEYQKLAGKISITRKAAAQKLCQLITEQMKLLGMQDGQFDILFQPNPKTAPTPYGLERVEFQVNANLGQSLQPLSKVASGGELSRISLAIQVILANQNTAATLIFDEVDVGIGGKTAEIVGKLLRQLSSNAQIICVTHLPQVAACGNHHFKVEKSTQHARTSITVDNLIHEARILEIARMLGGVNITARTIAHAEEMIAHTNLQN